MFTADDPRWCRPIWEDYPRGEFTHNRHTPDAEYVRLVTLIRAHLSA